MGGWTLEKQIQLKERINIPLFQLIQANIVWSTNACFLLPPLPLHQLLLHKHINDVLSPVQNIIQA